jgi:hypothetical protein
MWTDTPALRFVLLFYGDVWEEYVEVVMNRAVFGCVTPCSLVVICRGF